MRTILQFKGKDIPKKFKDLARKTPELKQRGLYDTAVEAKAEFEKTVSTWKNKPDFEIVDTPRGMKVVTDSEIYGYVDKGTRAHKIPVGDKGFLAFQGNYQAKTVPRVVMSRSGGASGGYVYTQKDINHPGTEARDFTKIIIERAQKTVGENITKRLKEGMEAVGL